VPLARHDLIKEDHYQMLRTLDDLVRDRKDITENTKFMLEMMRESGTIEEAMFKIVSKVEIGGNIFLKTLTGEQRSEFAHRLIRNFSLGTGTYNRPFRMQNIEKILSLEPK
jgi:hypothetical protein